MRPFPALRPGFDKDQARLEFFEAAHSYIAYGLMVVLTARILSVLKHHFISQDDVLRRMTWGR